MNSTTKAIVLIHGLWMTLRSWDGLRDLYERRGYEVIAPPWPRMEGTVEELRHDPSALAGLGVEEIVAHYEKIVRALDEPPILIGHSFGGLFVQMLLDRGLGAAGVAIDATAPKGIFRLPLSVLKAASPALSNPFNYTRAVMLTFAQFRYAFANTMIAEAARAAYERDVVPGPGRPLFQAALANLNPWAATRVNHSNGNRPPLLLISGSDDNLVPAVLNKINAHKYARSKAITHYHEFAGRSHLIVAQDGWEEVADYAISWAEENTAASPHEAATAEFDRSRINLARSPRSFELPV